ncbi:hypothetical protein [Picosynechococcus sp. NKBG15041c]|uniref:hypothetical protein n=1 Tax=Picosynechococcus sp. NKBG15041c TaxID=1407650 RepID=UPI00040F9601|nr:hypothetical protein [Picosynechococcus sp. NKBG15041c]
MTIPADSYVRLDLEPLTPQLTLCHGVIFSLDHGGLLTLLQAKSQGQNLSFTDTFCQTWRAHVLLREHNLPQCSLSFVLRYEGVDVTKILLGLDGDILHQVAQDLLLSPSLYYQLAEVQAWLMAQLWAQLPWQGQGRWLGKLAWLLAIALVLISVAISWATISAQPLLILPILVVFGLLGWGLQRLLLKQLRLPLRRWLLTQVLWGHLARSDRLRHWGLHLLHYL